MIFLIGMSLIQLIFLFNQITKICFGLEQAKTTIPYQNYRLLKTDLKRVHKASNKFIRYDSLNVSNSNFLKINSIEYCCDVNCAWSNTSSFTDRTGKWIWKFHIGFVSGNLFFKENVIRKSRKYISA